MNFNALLNAQIKKYTLHDPAYIVDDVITNFFDDKIDIVNIIVKHRNNPKLVGNVLINMLDETIKEAVREYESLDENDDALESKLMDKEIARAANARSIL